MMLVRPSKLTPEQRREAIKRRDEGEETRAEIARRYGGPLMTVVSTGARNGED
jgi:transposase-like protein